MPAQTIWYAAPTAGHETHGHSAVSDEQTGKTIALVYDGKAHANTIAAAPETLAALRQTVRVIVDALDNMPYLFPARGDSTKLTAEQRAWREKLQGDVKTARAAIAKAVQS